MSNLRVGIVGRWQRMVWWERCLGLAGAPFMLAALAMAMLIFTPILIFWYGHDLVMGDDER